MRYVFWSRFKFFVYSAYFDNRVSGAGTPAGKSQGVVRVISATKTRGPERVWCRLWYRQQNGANVTVSVTVAAKVKVRSFQRNNFISSYRTISNFKEQSRNIILVLIFQLP